jgi:hypothetical protein
MNNCLISAKMTVDKCQAHRHSNPACIPCKGVFSRTLHIDLPGPDYDILTKTAKQDGTDFIAEITLLLREMAAIARGEGTSCVS